MNNSKTYDILLSEFFPDGHFNITHSPHPKSVNGKAGFYKVCFTLSKPDSPLSSELDITHSELIMGNSHLKMSKSDEFNVSLKNNNDNSIENCRLKLMLNQTRVLAKIICPKVYANNFENAVLKAHRATAMFLSQLSLYLDIPLNIFQIDSTELKTKISRISIVAPFIELQINGDLKLGSDSPELSNYASYYREALNSNSVAYKFLCYFKIIEGINIMRKRINTERKEQGLEPLRPAFLETIPDSEGEQIKFISQMFPFQPSWIHSKLALDAIFVQEAKGKRISSLFANKLNDIRVQIAHGLEKSGEPTISLDEAINLNEIIKWLPITRLIARLMIQNQFSDFPLH